MVGLEYIHGQNIMHRDIKPENLVFDAHGYLRITDFGIAKHYVVNNKKDTSGTIGYLAPEVLCNENHTFSIDYYAVGIITYELMYGHRPYLGKSKHEVKHLILTRQAQIDYDELPDGYANEAADFVNRLIQRKPKNRLGRDSINEVINHPWFDDFDWDSVKRKKYKAPYVPKVGDNFDRKYCLEKNKVGTDTMERYKKIMMEPNIDNVFKGFSCDRIPEELKGINLKTKLNDTAFSTSKEVNSTTSISRNNRPSDSSKQNIQQENKSIGQSKQYSQAKQITAINKALNSILQDNNDNQQINLNELKQSLNQNTINIGQQNYKYNNNMIANNNNNNMSNNIINNNNNIINNNNSNSHSFSSIALNNQNSVINLKQQDLLYATRRHNKILGYQNMQNNPQNISNYNSLNNSQMNSNLELTKNYYNSINNSFNNSNTNSLLKRSTSNTITKKKPDIKKELLNGSYYPNKSTKLFMGSTTYKKHKPLPQNPISQPKRLTSSHSMQNLKQTISGNNTNNNYFGNPNINVINGLSSSGPNSNENSLKNPVSNSLSKTKSKLIYDKKLPFINISLTKKRGTVLGNEIYYVSYGKYKQGNMNGLTDRLKNTKQKLRNSMNSSISKAQYLTKKHSPGKKGNLSYFI